MPEDCVENESCQAIVAVSVVDERYEFELESGVGRWFVVNRHFL